MMLRLVFACLLLLLPNCCLGQGTNCISPDLASHLLFLQEDVDGDGILHMSEMIATFHQYDTNNDGRISRHEYTQHEIDLDPTTANMAHALYDIWDINGDHHLEQADFQAFYRRLDTDGDDSVTNAEYMHGYAEVICHIAVHHTMFCTDTCA